MARSRTLIPLLVGFILLLAMSCAFAEEGKTLAIEGGDPCVAAPLPMDVQLNPVFEAAAKKYHVPVELLLTLGWYGSNFENRGAAPTIEGGYGIMALRDNILGGDSLLLGSDLIGIPVEAAKVSPEANIHAAAAVLGDYAKEMKIKRNQGLDAWLDPVIRYAGLDEENSRLFAAEVFGKLQSGLRVVNSAGEEFSFAPQDIGSVDLEDLGLPADARGKDVGEDDGGQFGILSADYGPAIWDPAASCNYTDGYYPKDTIVVHTIEGTAAGARSWFKNCASQVSAHYVIAENGTIWQMVEEVDMAWHVGCYNSRSIGLEHEGYASSPSHPQTLYDASGLLSRDICDSWGIPKEKRTVGPGILGHVDVTICCCGTHTDPGAGWNWNYYMSVVAGKNPPYLFDGGIDGWSPGNSTSAIWWTGYPAWGGSMYFDQTGNDCFVYSPFTNFAGVWGPQVVNVNFYAQNGSTASHDMQLFWKTNAENWWDEPKSSGVVYYTAQNSWATLNLNVNNSKWWGQTINRLRLDFDNTNHGNRWIVNHLVLQDQFWYHFDWGGDVMGWTAGNSLTAPWQTSCCGWPGILVTDQTGNDAFMYGPPIPVSSGWPFHYLGGVNDQIYVRVYPQSGNSASHDMAVYWTTETSGWSEANSTHVNFTGQNQWVNVYLPVGANPNWGNAAHITRLRLDFDSTNHGTRWIVDYIRSVH